MSSMDHSTFALPSTATSPSRLSTCKQLLQAHWSKLLIAALVLTTIVLIVNSAHSWLPSSLIAATIDSFLLWLDSLDHSPTTVAVFALLIAVTCLPCTTGYGMSVMLCGYVFRWWSLPITYAASVVGGCLSFTIASAVHRRYHITPNTLLASFPSARLQLLAIERATISSPYKVSALLQSSVFPYGAASAVLGLWALPFRAYLFGSLVSRLKCIDFALVATALSAEDLHALFTGGQHKAMTTSDWMRTIISVSVAVGTLMAITSYSRAQLQLVEAEAEREAAAAATAVVTEVAGTAATSLATNNSAITMVSMHNQHSDIKRSNLLHSNSSNNRSSDDGSSMALLIDIASSQQQ